MRVARLLLAAAALLLGPGAAAAPPAKTAPAAKKPRAPITEPELRQLLDTWLATQNQGAFDKYQQLYAPRFAGIRRSGPRTVRFGYQGWLQDRKRMFAKPMKVAAERVVVTPGRAQGVLRFDQRWSSGNYSDVGPKELVLVRDRAGGLRIVREEMLFSQPTGSGFAGRLLATPDLVQLVEGDAVLAVTADYCRPAADAAAVDLRCDVPDKWLPPEILAWKGRALSVWSGPGEPCTARITAFQMVGHVEGDTTDMTAQDQWDAAKRLLVGRLDGACSGTWARVAALPRPTALAGSPADAPAALQRKVAGEVGALPSWKELVASYEADEKECADADPPCRLQEGGVGVQEIASVSARGPRRVALASTAATLYHGDGSIMREAELTALYEVTETKRGVKLRLLDTLGVHYVLVSAFDLDGDGRLELLLETERGGARNRVLLAPDKDGHLAEQSSVTIATVIEPPGC